MLNNDYKEMLQCLSEEDVKYLLVGAYALVVHGFPRATKDIDFFVWATPENAVNLMRALRKLAHPWRESRSRTFHPKESSSRLAIAHAASTSSLLSTVFSSTMPIRRERRFRSKVCRFL
jgi:hypothetical protein